MERRVASKFHSAPFPIVIIEKQIEAYIVNRRYPLVIARVSRAYMDSSLCSLKKKKKKNDKERRNDGARSLVGSWAFGGTIRLISASVHDYNDNTGLCSGRGVRGGAQYPLRGAQVFRVKFFLRRCGSGRDHLLARLSCLYAPVQKGGGGGQQVAASTSLAVAFFFIVISLVDTVHISVHGWMDEQTNLDKSFLFQENNYRDSSFKSTDIRRKKLIRPVVKAKLKVGTKIEKLIRNFIRIMVQQTIAYIIKAVQFNYNRVTHLLHHLFKIFTFRIE